VLRVRYFFAFIADCVIEMTVRSAWC